MDIHLDYSIPGYRDLSLRPTPHTEVPQLEMEPQPEQEPEQEPEPEPEQEPEIQPQPLENDISTDFDNSYQDVVYVNPENGAETLLNVQIKSEPPLDLDSTENIPEPDQLPNNIRVKVHLPKSFVDELKFCREYFKELSEENDSLRSENNDLHDENHTLKIQLQQALRQIDMYKH